MKVTYREALKSREGFLPWRVRGKLLKVRRGTIEVLALYLAMVVMFVVLSFAVSQMGRTLVGEGLDMTYTLSFVRFLVSWIATIFGAIVAAVLAVVTFKELVLEILDIERALIARADEEVEL